METIRINETVLHLKRDGRDVTSMMSTYNNSRNAIQRRHKTNE